MIETVLLAGGLFVGIVVGRWWILLAPVALGAWTGFTAEVDEIPSWFLGVASAAIARRSAPGPRP